MTSPRVRIGLTAAVGVGIGLAAAVHRHRTGYVEHGYEPSVELDVGSDEFLRALEALTGAAVTTGNDLRVLINGDDIFPAVLETIRGSTTTLNLLTFVYWRGDIAV